MKRVIAVAALGLSALALAADESLYATVEQFKDGREFQIWKPLPQQACVDHIRVINPLMLPDRGQTGKLACALADTVATKHVKDGKNVTASVFGLTTKKGCEAWLLGPLRPDPKTPNVTYTCDKKK